MASLMSPTGRCSACASASRATKDEEHGAATTLTAGEAPIAAGTGRPLRVSRLVLLLLSFTALAALAVIYQRRQRPSAASAATHQEEREPHARKLLTTAISQVAHKKVVIAGEGRSGSTLVGTLFKAQEWTYYYEPLRFSWPAFEKAKEEEVKAVGWPPPLRCSVHYPRQCTAANAAALLEVISCERTNRPLELLLREAAETAKQPAQPVPWIGTRNHEAATVGSAALIRAAGVYGADAAALPKLAAEADRLTPAQVEEQLKDCKGKKGVAAKVIRMTGRLGELFDVADALRVKMDLVIHLVRDPRAVLASRYSVGWLHPVMHTYEDTFRWAQSLCTGMMDDALAVASRPEYMLLRYEDLAGGAEARARVVYQRIGSPVPEAVLRAARVYDGCGSGSEWERQLCVQDRERMAKEDDGFDVGYNTRPRDFAEAKDKWKKSLAEEEVRAVEDACVDVFNSIYLDARLYHAATQR